VEDTNLSPTFKASFYLGLSNLHNIENDGIIQVLKTLTLSPAALLPPLSGGPELEFLKSLWMLGTEEE
jgi:hypothetical protein